MNSLLHNAWFWFSLTLLLLYLVMVEVILPRAVAGVMANYTAPSSVAGLNEPQSYIVQPLTVTDGASDDTRLQPAILPYYPLPNHWVQPTRFENVGVVSEVQE